MTSILWLFFSTAIAIVAGQETQQLLHPLLDKAGACIVCMKLQRLLSILKQILMTIKKIHSFFCGRVIFFFFSLLFNSHNFLLIMISDIWPHILPRVVVCESIAHFFSIHHIFSFPFFRSVLSTKVAICFMMFNHFITAFINILNSECDPRSNINIARPPKANHL